MAALKNANEFWAGAMVMTALAALGTAVLGGADASRSGSIWLGGLCGLQWRVSCDRLRSLAQ